MSQQEDDLRALAKIMDFLRATSILLAVINIYWFCYEAIAQWGVNIGVVDKMLMDFQIDNMTFEVGGKNKKQKQLQGLDDGYVVKDDIEMGYANVIPLWQFGLEY